MKPSNKFFEKNSSFWAVVKYSSEQLGYSNRRKKGEPITLKRYKIEDVKSLQHNNNQTDNLLNEVVEYLNYRSEVIENEVSKLLMDREEASELFYKLKKELNPTCCLPMNKQKGKKKHNAYFTCIINMLTEANLKGREFDDDPGRLALIKNDEDKLICTLSRRVDGAYPSIEKPLAIWEVKEYYGTTTFGSRVADGVYETQLDGFELKEAEKKLKHKVFHYLFVDDRLTWWVQGRSYLCRLFDTMHTGLVDEVIFGREVLDRWPKIVSSWLDRPSQ